MLPDNIASAEHEEMPATAGDSVCAIVVAYFPDEEFDARIRELLPQVARIVIVDNTPDECLTARLRERLQNTAQVHLIDNRANTGISVALNQGLEHALKAGYKWILTLDQDTQCYPGYGRYATQGIQRMQVESCCNRRQLSRSTKQGNIRTDHRSREFSRAKNGHHLGMPG